MPGPSPVMGAPQLPHFTHPLGNHHLVQRHEVRGGSWENTGAFFEQKIPRHTRGRLGAVSQIVFDGTTAFYLPDGLMENHDEIHLYDFSARSDTSPLTVLTQEHDAREQNGLGTYLHFDRAAVLADGYLIEVRYLVQGEWRYVHDYFNKQGAFQKRVEMGAAKLIPVQNTDELFLFRDPEEGPMLTLFVPPA